SGNRDRRDLDVAIQIAQLTRPSARLAVRTLDKMPRRLWLKCAAVPREPWPERTGCSPPDGEGGNPRWFSESDARLSRGQVPSDGRGHWGARAGRVPLRLRRRTTQERRIHGPEATTRRSFSRSKRSM